MLSRLIERVYPIPAGESGSVKRGVYATGGVSIVLRTPPPYLVLRHVVKRRGAHGTIAETAISAEAHDTNPFPIYEISNQRAMPFAPETDKEPRSN